MNYSFDFWNAWMKKGNFSFAEPCWGLLRKAQVLKFAERLTGISSGVEVLNYFAEKVTLLFKYKFQDWGQLLELKFWICSIVVYHVF